jgi:myosin heavy subunit
MTKLAQQAKSIEMFQFGKTKLFLKGGQLAVLEDLRTKRRYDAAVTFQKYIKTSIEVSRFKRYQAATKILQSISRMKKAKAVTKERREKRASTNLQKYIRMWNFRRIYIFEIGRESATLTLQRYIRMWETFSTYRDLRKRVVTVQSRCRGILARRHFHKIKDEALKASNLIRQNRQLQEKVRSLEDELSVEKLNTVKISAEEARQKEAEFLALKAKLESQETDIQSKNETLSKLQQADIKSTKKNYRMDGKT